MPRGIYRNPLAEEQRKIRMARLGFSNRGRKQNPEWREKSILSCKRFWFKKGNKLGNKFKKGHIGWNKGKKLTLETRLKMSKSRQKEKCHFWKGGITEKNLKIKMGLGYRLWREAIYKRDKYTCQICGDKKGNNLNAHHLQNFSQFPKLRFAIDNGITLCDRCHIKFHKKFGNRKNTKKQFILWLLK